jgi:hypothetical protein
MKYWLVGLIKRWSGAIYAWASLYECCAHGLEREQTKKLIAREMDEIQITAVKAFEFQLSEQNILSERLGRRYDLGMALNESANRALAAKKAAKTEGEVPKLTGSQLAALRYQEKYLQDIVRKS